MLITERSRLASLRALNLLDTAPEERFDQITRLAQRTFNMPIVAFCLVDEKRVWFKSAWGLGFTEIPRSASISSETILGHELLLVPDASKDSRFQASPLVTGEPRMRFYAGQPIAGPDGAIVGTLVLIDRAPRELDLEQRRALRDLAGMVEEQLAATAAIAFDDGAGDHARVLARLRDAPVRQAKRLRVRAGFAAAALAVLAATAVSIATTRRLSADADRLEAALAASPAFPDRPAGAQSLARIRSTVRFLRGAAAVRALGAWLLLYLALGVYDRDAETRILEHADMELEHSHLERIIAASASAERLSTLRRDVERTFDEAGGGDPIPSLLQRLGAGLDRVYVELWTVDKAQGRLRQEASWRDDTLPAADFARLSFDTTFKRGVGLAGRVWEHRASLWVADLAQASNFPRAADAAKAGIRSAFAVPALAQGEVLGVLAFFGARVEEPDAKVLALADAVGARIGLYLRVSE